MARPEIESGGGIENRSWRLRAAANTLAVTALAALAAACGNDSEPCEANFDRASEKVITMPDGELVKAGVFGDRAYYVRYDEGEMPTFGDFLGFNDDISAKELKQDGDYRAAVFPYDNEYELVVRTETDDSKVETFCQPVDD
jgi:hypothetical protein